MTKKREHTGIAVALAWPQTYCKQPGAWYDPIALFLGINTNNYYKVGHAALLLLDPKEKKAHYFDFGRYHAPYQYGRVRSAETDHELVVNTTPVFSSNHNNIENFREILSELQNNKACHGEGELYAAYCNVNFELAYAKAKQMQAESPIPYGPFVPNGSNCSRFVNKSMRAGNPSFKYRFGLKFMMPLTPTPLSNVNALRNKQIIPKIIQEETFCPSKKLSKQVLISTLPAPERHSAVPGNAQWLSGEGAGSWFVFILEGTQLKVTRYSPDGVVECDGFFENPDALPLLKEQATFSISHPSNCKSVALKISNTEVQFQRIT